MRGLRAYYVAITGRRTSTSALIYNCMQAGLPCCIRLHGGFPASIACVAALLALTAIASHSCCFVDPICSWELPWATGNAWQVGMQRSMSWLGPPTTSKTGPPHNTCC